MNSRNGLKTDSGPSYPAVAELVEDLANRLQAGEPIDLEAVIREHPDQANHPRRLLPTVRVLAELGSAADASTPPARTWATHRALCR